MLNQATAITASFSIATLKLIKRFIDQVKIARQASRISKIGRNKERAAYDIL